MVVRAPLGLSAAPVLGPVDSRVIWALLAITHPGGKRQTSLINGQRNRKLHIAYLRFMIARLLAGCSPQLCNPPKRRNGCLQRMCSESSSKLLGKFRKGECQASEISNYRENQIVQ